MEKSEKKTGAWIGAGTMKQNRNRSFIYSFSIYWIQKSKLGMYGTQAVVCLCLLQTNKLGYPPLPHHISFLRSARCQARGDILINAADVGLGFGFFETVVSG